ncbi:MAG TPA: lysylphosphatidylglycerol synthase domain-containing protein [Coleofasciculaceae cyanobacterium]
MPYLGNIEQAQKTLKLPVVFIRPEVMRHLKPLLKWIVLGATLFFLGSVLRHNWHQVLQIRLTPSGWGLLAISLGVTLLAHCCAGWVWYWILQDFRQSVSLGWAISIYLKTNVAKYLPGNVWHYYGRITSAHGVGVPLEVATVSVLLEPILMLAAALLLALVSGQQILAQVGVVALLLQAIGLVAVLLMLRPQVLNPAIGWLKRAKQKASGDSSIHPKTEWVNRYPLKVLLGEILFLLLRAMGFILTLASIASIPLTQLPILLSSFSLAWLMGLVVPGAPGGLGVFEAAAVALLGPVFSPAIILSGAALYRLISVLAETIGAGLAVLAHRLAGQSV